MPEPDLIVLFAEPLNAAGVRYLISGSVAAMLYGEPRITHDIDLVAFLCPEDVERLRGIFPAPAFYVPPTSSMLEELRRQSRGHFNVIHGDSGLKADFYPAGNDDFHAWALEHGRRYSVGGNMISLAPPEYVIIRKLEYYREGGSEKHLRDIRGMLAVTGDQLDRSAIIVWAARRNVSAEWQLIAEQMS